MRSGWIATPLLLQALLFLSPLAQAEAPAGQRDFYAALDDTLSDFEFDLKHESVVGIEDMAVRNVSVSESVPRSFSVHMEDLIAERVLRATKSRILQCQGCHTRRTTMKNGQLAIITADINPKENLRIAKARGIKHFLDVAFSYQPSGLLVSMQITEPDTSIALWSHTYNSETSRAAMLRRGVDLDALDPSTRKSIEYPAVLQYRLRLDYLFEPDVGSPSGCLGFAFQMVERYDNRKKELGFEMEYLKASSTLIGKGGASSSLYSSFNLTLLMLHAFNLIVGQEDYNLARASINMGVGGTFTSGYLGALFRVGFEWREAKHFATGAILGFRPSSTAFLSSTTAGQNVAGVEIGAGVSYFF